jgi:hypothetical protein
LSETISKPQAELDIIISDTIKNKQSKINNQGQTTNNQQSTTNNPKTFTLTTMNADFDLSFGQNFFGEYLRNNKTNGQKNLRCFPACCADKVCNSFSLDSSVHSK